MSNVMTISKRTASGLEEVLRMLLLDSENKVPSERLRIVGAVAEGYIIESGTNVNGNWLKLADGTQVCWGVVEGSAEVNATECIATCIFPAAFVSVPVGWVGCGRWETLNLYLYGTTTTGCALRATIGEGSSAFIVPFVFLVIGRWKA